MTVYTSFARGGTKGNANAYNNRPYGYDVVQFDVAKFVATNGFVSGDTEVLLTIPARSKFILDAVYSDTTPVMGTTPVISLGDTSSNTVFINAQTVPAANVSVVTMAATAKIYDAASTIRLTLANSGGTIVSGKITIVFAVIDLSPNPDATATPSI